MNENYIPGEDRAECQNIGQRFCIGSATDTFRLFISSGLFPVNLHQDLNEVT